MHSIDPTDFSHAELPVELPTVADPIDYSQPDGGWTCHGSDGLAGTDFTYHDGQLVDIHQNFSNLGHLDTSFGLDDRAFGETLGNSGWELGNGDNIAVTVSHSELSTDDFMAHHVELRSGSYDEAAANQSQADFTRSMADSWGNAGYLDKAAQLEKDADYYQQKATDALPQNGG
jgi:hypothetical protein